MPSIHLQADDAIDLHMHTTYSDGHWSPPGLFDQLASDGFKLVAVTDHDRLDRVAEMQALGAARGIAVLVGVEVTTNWHGHTAHLLCYAGELTGDALAGLTRATDHAQLENTRAVYDELLRQGYTFPQQAEVLHEQGGEVVRPIDNIRLLQAHGHAADAGSAFAMIGAAGYHSISVPLAEAITAAHASGAITILAHPGRSDIHLYELADLAEVVAEVPLDGIEVFYPTYTEAQRTQYEAFAREHAALMSAGSDSHGPRQRFPIRYPAQVCAPLLARCGVTVAG